MLCLIGTVFADLYPIPFIIKMSFWRSTFIYLMVALPCIGYVLSRMCNHTIARRLLVISIMVLVSGYLNGFKLYYFPILLCLLLYALYEKQLAERFIFFRGRFMLLFLSVLCGVLVYQTVFDQGSSAMILFLLHDSVSFCDCAVDRIGITPAVWVFIRFLYCCLI